MIRILYKRKVANSTCFHSSSEMQIIVRIMKILIPFYLVLLSLSKENILNPDGIKQGMYKNSVKNDRIHIRVGKVFEFSHFIYILLKFSHSLDKRSGNSVYNFVCIHLYISWGHPNSMRKNSIEIGLAFLTS